MQKNLLIFLFISLVITLVLLLGYQLHQEADLTQNMKHQLQLVIEGGGKIIRDDIKQITIFKNEDGIIKYIKINYNKETKQEELYNAERIISLNYNSSLKEQIKFKKVSKLSIK
ncbi:MAG: hypothetical protein ACQEQI_06605 [Bacillota bacterium]